MAVMEFILGFALGISIYFWKQHQFKRQLRRTLNTFPDDLSLLTSLSPISVVKRQIQQLHWHNQELEKERYSWKDLLENAPLGYLQIDEENRLLWCNQQAKQLLKLDRWQEGQVRLLLELVRSYELDRLIQQTRHTQQTQEQEWVFYFTKYAPTVSRHSASESDYTAPISTGVEAIALKGYGLPLPFGQVGIFIENRQELVELSHQSDRAFADLAHELRTPLTSIALVSENLVKRLNPPERRWVEQMLKETNRLVDLVQRGLELTRLQDNPSQTLHYQTVELKQLIDSVWQTLEPIAAQKQVIFTYRGVESLQLQADRSLLIQVILNLLDNAIKHSPLQGEILVETSIVNAELPQAAIAIDIIDCGSGFIKTDLPFVFDRFYRGEKSRVRQSHSPSSGSGLGLAIVRQIIQAHGGSIEAQNHPQLGGAWLRIILPQYPSK